MKKIVFAVLFTLVIISAAFSQSAVIRELSGEVEIKREGSAVFVKASAGDTIAANTIISTGFRSTAIVAAGSSLITVRPLTRLSLAEIQTLENSENTSINLQSGRVRVEVNPPAGTRANLTVQSPSTTASVRGTSFEMDTVNLSVVTGKVIYSGSSGPAAMITAGNSSFSSTNGTAADPVEIKVASLAPSAPVGAPSSDSIPQPSVTTGELNILLYY